MPRNTNQERMLCRPFVKMENENTDEEDEGVETQERPREIVQRRIAGRWKRLWQGA